MQNQFTKGEKVTVLCKGVPFANTIVIDSKKDRFGQTYYTLQGVRDEYGELMMLGANEVRKVTNGWYNQKPV